MTHESSHVIIEGKLKRALNYQVTGIKLWKLLAGALVAFVAGAWIF